MQAGSEKRLAILHLAHQHALSTLDWVPLVLLTSPVRLSAGGELQRFAIAVVAAQDADVYMVDEPSSYLDVRQRLKAAQVGLCFARRVRGPELP